MGTLGHFDIYGCLLAICLLLIRGALVWLYILLAAMISVDPRSDPPHSSFDVCAGDRGHLVLRYYLGAGNQP